PADADIDNYGRATEGSKSATLAVSELRLASCGVYLPPKYSVKVFPIGEWPAHRSAFRSSYRIDRVLRRDPRFLQTDGQSIRHRLAGRAAQSVHQATACGRPQCGQPGAACAELAEWRRELRGRSPRRRP